MAEDQARALLLDYIRRVRALREGVRELNADKAEVKKEARDKGFDSTKIEEVVRWLEKVDKHGRAAMDEAEAVYELYRSAVDTRDPAGRPQSFDEIMSEARDRALLKLFAPDDQLAPKPATAKQRALSDAVALARLNGRGG